MAANLATTNSSITRWLRRRNSRHVSHLSPITLGGSQRSGTTLLRVLLDSHPHIACGPESSLFTGGFLPEKLAKRFDVPLEEVWRLRKEASDHAHFIERFFTEYAARRGKPRWAEKTPQNVRHIGWIFQHFPNAKFVHVIRDGRDTVCSIRTHPRFRLIDGEKIPTGIRRPLEPCIESWLRDTAEGMKWRGHANYMEVRYESLVDTPEPTLRGLCEFFGEPWDDALLRFDERGGTSREVTHFITNVAATQPISREAVGRWRTDLSASEQELFHKLAGKRLEELGYRSEPVGSAEESAAAQRGQS